MRNVLPMSDAEALAVVLVVTLAMLVWCAVFVLVVLAWGG